MVQGCEINMFSKIINYIIVYKKYKKISYYNIYNVIQNMYKV